MQPFAFFCKSQSGQTMSGTFFIGFCDLANLDNVVRLKIKCLL
jgi:hypothetical protein